MFKKFFQFLGSLRMTVLSGVFLAGSLVLLLCKYQTAWNPALFTLVISGLPLVFEAFRDLFKGRITSPLLVTIAMVSCVFLGEYFAAGEIAFIMTLGEVLERRTVRRARRGMRRLFELAPTHCSRLTAGHETLITVDAVQVGDLLRIRPGEVIPVDGILKTSGGAVDESHLTGEVMPVEKKFEDMVYSGSVNGDSMLEIEAVNVGENSSLQQLIKMVKSAEENKAPVERIADKVATWLVPAAFLLAVIIGIVMHDLTKAVTVLVVFCPCALFMATPTAIVAAIGQAAKRGVVIKSGAALETLARVDRMAFDKTGTLTCGELAVTTIIPLDGLDVTTLLQIAASAESCSEHPIGRAIHTAALNKFLNLKTPDEFKAYRGRGLRAMLNDFEVFCGSESFFREIEIPIGADTETMLLQLRAAGATAVLVAGDGQLCGIIGLTDTLRPNAAETVYRLGKIGAKPVLVTGDHLRTAERYAADLSIFELGADLLPADKAAYVQQIQSEKHVVCMVGDGINDALALQTADVGVAMGKLGSNIAIETADIVLVSDELKRLVYLKNLANITRSVIVLNIIMALSINVAGIFLSVVGWVGPVIGALIHNIGALAVIFNAAMLYDRKIRE